MGGENLEQVDLIDIHRCVYQNGYGSVVGVEKYAMSVDTEITEKWAYRVGVKMALKVRCCPFCGMELK